MAKCPGRLRLRTVPGTPAVRSAASGRQTDGASTPSAPRTISDITISTLIRAAWALVAGRMINSDDVVFGITVPGRTASVGGIDEMAGPSIAIVPVRVKLASDQRVSEYLTTVQGQAMEIISFEQTGLQQISKMCPGGQQACKFQTLLVIQPQESSSSPDLLGEWRDDGQQQWFNTCALMLEVRLGLDKITARASFDSRAIDPWAVQKLLERLEFVMRQLDSADPEKMLAGIEIATQQDLEKIWEWNRIVPATVERCVHEMIEERAQAQPSAPAVCAWDGELTYGELDQLATRLAGRLVELDVGPDVLVPLCFEKSMWTTVAILGVLKAGGGFVLLDPSLPEQRLQDIVRQVKGSLVLSSLSNYALSSRLAQRVVTVSSSFFRNLGNKPTQHLSGLCPSSVVYVVFTSGSTGTPKGVVISHRNVASALHHQLKLRGLTADSRVFDFASYGFDATISNAFTTLLAGGCLCVPSDQDRKNKLAESIASFHANVVDLTPSVAQFLVPEKTTQLQIIILAGEKVHIREVRHWWGKVRVLQAYGPSECTTLSTINCSASSPEEATRIGKGAGLVTWVVDPENHDHLLPLGSIGELLLEGPLVGPGYLNNPEKTASVFIENPVWLLRGAPDRPGRHGRLYKTGDLVRYNEDGSLTFIGRKDMQVKIRGQRVELREVEHRVQECMPEAEQVVAEVIVPEGENPSPTLAVFIQMSEDVAETDGRGSFFASLLSIDGLEGRLAEHLPSSMIPTVFFSMRELPMTTTGKTNRKRLREIGGSFSVQQLAEMRTAGRDTERQPTSEVERQMQRIWGQVLNINPATIGLDDSFFRLGGDSIAAMKVVGEARKVGVELAVADIFRHPTLEHLAHLKFLNGKALDKDFDQDSLVGPIGKAALLAEIDSLDIGIRSGAVADILPLTQFQEDCVVAGVTHPRRICNYFYIDLGVSLDILDFKRRCSLTLERFPILRACFLHLLGKFWQVVLNQLDLPLHIKDVNKDLDRSFRDFCLKDMEDISQNRPPLAFVLLSHRVQGIRFVLRLSHAQYDGISLPTIFRSIVDSYNDKAFLQPPSFSRFLAYAYHCRFQSISYWKELLRGSSITTTYSKLAPPGIYDSLPQGIRIEAQISLPHLPGNITSASLLCSAWAVLLSRITGESDVVYGRLVAGRHSAIKGIEEIVGPVSTLSLFGSCFLLFKLQPTCCSLFKISSSRSEKQTHWASETSWSTALIGRSVPSSTRSSSTRTSMKA